MMVQRLRDRRLRLIIAGSSVAALGLLASGLQATPSGATTGSSVFVASYSAQNTVARNFNPFFETAPLGLDGELDIQLIYEPLL